MRQWLGVKEMLFLPISCPKTAVNATKNGQIANVAA